MGLLTAGSGHRAHGQRLLHRQGDGARWRIWLPLTGRSKRGFAPSLFPWREGVGGSPKPGQPCAWLPRGGQGRLSAVRKVTYVHP